MRASKPEGSGGRGLDRSTLDHSDINNSNIAGSADFSRIEDPVRRFGRMARLVGAPAMEKLRRSHVMVIGCGGVGSWAAETAVRAAVGRVTLVDFDTFCIRNFNRQAQALSGNIGKSKALLLAGRLRLVNPETRIDGVEDHFNRDTCASVAVRHLVGESASG